MNNNTLLISYEMLTKSTALTENIDPKIIRPLIKECQEMDVAPVLGVALFEKLKAGIVADNLTEDYKTLINEMIKPVLVNAILRDLPFSGNYRFNNTGLVERTAESSRNVDPKEMQKLSDYYKSRAVWYSGKLTRYLCDNVALFPEYRTNEDVKDAPRLGQYDTSIYLG